MFILPAQAHPVDAAAAAFPAVDWHRVLAPLHLPLILALVFVLVRIVFLVIPMISKGNPETPMEKADEKALLTSLSLNPPVAQRGRHVSRGVGSKSNARRPDAAARAVRPMIEAPLPAIYESETPVSMAKIIMSRHTYRAPPPRRTPPPARPLSLPRPIVASA
ncbi:hypothetical protein K438DRAFT_1833414 [Mycena galopus ATCC 62051]|nr:hypothetical protein K438DRAFT_1833414 [Mycena galopus ATCC 62051]